MDIKLFEVMKFLILNNWSLFFYAINLLLNSQTKVNRKLAILFILFFSFAIIVFLLPRKILSINQINVINKANDSLPEGLIKLQKAYPDFIAYITDNELVWKDSTRMIFDDKIIKNNIEELLLNADLQDQLEIPYTKGVVSENPKVNYDPGRIRNEAFFKKMYGNSEKAVCKKLVSIAWLPKFCKTKLSVTTINGVDKKLKLISDELENYPELKPYLINPAGTFNWRYIADSQMLSMHSFGIAIDINVKYSDYWKWNKSAKNDTIKYKNQIPFKIVEVFEKHGFIWGGKWYHFDTMHFEYRPELID